MKFIDRGSGDELHPFHRTGSGSHLMVVGHILLYSFSSSKFHEFQGDLINNGEPFGMTCQGCTSSSKLDNDFSMAFQPIYVAMEGRVWGYEALVRGSSGEGAHEVLSKISPEQKCRFDQDCRVEAIESASRLFPVNEDLKLSINFIPGAVYEPVACLCATPNAARRIAEKVLDSFPSCPIPEIAYLGRNLRRWRSASLAYITTERANNGGAEAVNGIIELHHRLARGYRNHNNYRLKMLLAAGGLTHDRHPMSEEPVEPWNQSVLLVCSGRTLRNCITSFG